jgi:hypothetical protein
MGIMTSKGEIMKIVGTTRMLSMEYEFWRGTADEAGDSKISPMYKPVSYVAGFIDNKMNLLVVFLSCNE